MAKSKAQNTRNFPIDAESLYSNYIGIWKKPYNSPPLCIVGFVLTTLGLCAILALTLTYLLKSGTTTRYGVIMNVESATEQIFDLYSYKIPSMTNKSNPLVQINHCSARELRNKNLTENSDESIKSGIKNCLGLFLNDDDETQRIPSEKVSTAKIVAQLANNTDASNNPTVKLLKEVMEEQYYIPLEGVCACSDMRTQKILTTALYTSKVPPYPTWLYGFLMAIAGLFLLAGFGFIVHAMTGHKSQKK